MNSPFNEAKYKALLKGLEAEELKLSYIKNENKTFRLDSTFFTKEGIKVDKKLKQNKHFYLKKSEVVSGPFGSTLKSHSYLSKGIPFVRIENIKGGFEISINNMVFISHDDNERLKNSQLFIDDLVLSKVGNTIGYYARVDEELKTCNISENNIGIKLSNYPTERKHYILTFLNSVFGKLLTIRRISGNAQPKLNVTDITEIPIPEFSTKFEKKISSTIIYSRELKHQSVYIYTQAEQILLEELGLKDFEPSNEPVNIKSFQESFLSTGRLDAEYYQKKYEDFIGLIKSYRNGFELFSSVCNLKDKNFNLDGRKEYKYIELANIGKTGDITGCTVSLGSDLPTRARRIVHENDVIISSIEGSLDSCALITKEYDNALCSTGFYVINSNKINSETLLILFKSELIQNILKKGCSGTILTAINKTELKQIPIPLIDYSKQQEISELVEESFALKKQSEEILETAKRAVEIAIEEDEKKAIEYINLKGSEYA